MVLPSLRSGNPLVASVPFRHRITKGNSPLRFYLFGVRKSKIRSPLSPSEIEDKIARTPVTGVQVRRQRRRGKGVIAFGESIAKKSKGSPFYPCTSSPITFGEG